jgi:DeoD family purine-nucleoside phosphorylase
VSRGSAIDRGVSHIVSPVPERAAADPLHLRPAAALAERVLLPGDPHRALTVAQALLTKPRMFNHHRGLWGYTGTGPDGAPVTVQATGMGGPSAAIVVSELITLGARRLVRIGTCGALEPELHLGRLVTAVEALAADGTSVALGATGRVYADPALSHHLQETEADRGVVAASSDLFYDVPAGLERSWRRQGAAVVEMEAATLFRLAARRGARAACVLAVSDLLDGRAGRERIDSELLEEMGVRLGRAGLDALLADAGGPAEGP